MAKTAELKKEIVLLENEISLDQQASEEEDVYRFEKFIENQLADIEYEAQELYEKIKVLRNLEKNLKATLQKIESGDPFDAVVSLNKEEPNFFASNVMKDKEFKRVVKSIYDNFG